uniref:C3H1-type domain-containing protein n=1 Tax=Gasterosteus aculeatus aculeatus TaxID=481459 RepID=A0AAQ4QXL8_GASAC
MDTPESPTQSPQSPGEEEEEEEEEEERVFSDSELLDSPDEDEDGVISNSELVHEEDNGVPEEDEVVLENQLDGEDEKEEDQDDGVIDTPQSPDSEQGESLNPEEDGDSVEKGYRDYQKSVSADPAEVDDDDDEGEEDMSKSEEEEDRRVMRAEQEQRRKAVMVREMKDDPASVSRELDEHELDYDEEVPEEPSIPAHDEEEDEEDTKAEGEEEEETGDKSNKKREKKPILPPSPRNSEFKRSGECKEPERMRRDSFRDKKKDEDDGEIDEGEIDDDDLEEGEVKDPSDRKIRPRPICRFFIKGNCTWGMNCRFIHPGVNDKGNYSLITKPDPFSPNGAPPVGPHPLIPNNPWAGPAVEELPPPPPPVEPPVESAWERGLRHAKEVLKKATIRKEQEPDFEEKRFNVTIGEDDREFDKENDFFRERSYRIIRDEMDFRDPVYGDQYADPYYDYEMEALWRGGQYENFRVQYTEAPLPYHYTERERERDPRERPRDRERERDHRERERRQREREREREKERMRRKEEWERDRMKRDEKERPKMRPPRDTREKKEEDKLKPRSPLSLPPNRPMEPPSKKEDVPVMRRPDEWKDPWRRSKSPRRRPGIDSPPRGRRRHRPSGSSVSLSNSSSGPVGSPHRDDSAQPSSALVIFSSCCLLCRRSLSVSSVSSVSSASSSGSSVRSADSDDMYADLASPVSSASSRSPTPNQPRKERGPARDRPPHKRPSKKDEPFREDRRKINPTGAPPRGGNPMPRSGPGSRGGHPVHPPPGIMGPPGSYGGSGSHKDIKLTLLNKQQADKGNRKRYLPADKDRPGSPLSKRVAMSPDRGRDKRIPGRPILPPRMDRPRGQGPRPMPPQGDRKRPLSPPAKSSGKGPAAPFGKPPAPGSTSAAGSGSSSGTNKPSNTLSRREELLKQLKAVEDAIARKRAKIPTK